MPTPLVGLMGVIAALMLGLVRFAVYGVVSVAAGLGVVYLDAHPGWALLGGGVIVTLWGAVMLMRFVREYRLPVGGEG